LIVATVPDDFPVIFSPRDNSYVPETFNLVPSELAMNKSLSISFEINCSPRLKF
jgi:hypothetical protein